MSVWTQAGPSIVAAFLASLVEFIEALTIVLAVGIIRGWKPALLGAAAGAVVLAILTLVFGPLLDAIPIGVLQVSVGMLLLLFGMRWLRKAILRAAGIVPLHDETKVFESETAELRALGTASENILDPVAVVTTFKAVLLEGLEVVFIVIAVGAAGKTLFPAVIGAAAAGVLVVVLGLVLHRPLAKVPENALKFVVGVLISAFGVFWIGEGLGFGWPGGDLAVLALAIVLLAASLITAWLARAAATPLAVGQRP
jgi:uncharacterized membrane protein